LGGETTTYEIESQDRAFEVRVEPLRDDTSCINGCIGLAVDVTERRHTQEEIRLLQTELAHASRLSVVGGMAAGIAHELNQPLTAIVTYTQACVRLLKSGKGKLNDLIATLERVADQGLRAGRIIRRMKTVSGARNSPIRLVDVNMLVTEVISFVDWEAHRHRVLIRRKLDDELPKIMADSTAVTQVMLILLRNAIQALEDSEGERQIIVRTGRAQDIKRVEVSITDSGPGLPVEYLDHLFEPFFSTKPDGVGMGLPISRSLIEGQGGRLWVVPGSPGGASFRFTLPLDEGAPCHES
jgi:two-component system sensor kinase FixL